MYLMHAMEGVNECLETFETLTTALGVKVRSYFHPQFFFPQFVKTQCDAMRQNTAHNNLIAGYHRFQVFDKVSWMLVAITIANNSNEF